MAENDDAMVETAGEHINLYSKTTSLPNDSCSYDRYSGQTANEGGAIYQENGSLEIKNINFTSNTSTYGGGAIHSRAKNGTLSGFKVTGGTFSLNQAGDGGGAIRARNGATITNVTFTENKTATGSGGALYLDNGGEISQSSFAGNLATSSGEGGAIYGKGALTIIGSDFSGNETTKGQGGALYLNCASAEISNSSFDGNKSTDDHAGAIFVAGGTSTISGTAVFSNNTAGTWGGAIYNTATLSITDASFSENSAKLGGAIMNTGTLTLSNVTFEGNKGTQEASSGAFYNLGGTVVIEGEIRLMKYRDQINNTGTIIIDAAKFFGESDTGSVIKSVVTAASGDWYHAGNDTAVLGLKETEYGDGKKYLYSHTASGYKVAKGYDDVAIDSSIGVVGSCKGDFVQVNNDTAVYLLSEGPNHTSITAAFEAEGINTVIAKDGGESGHFTIDEGKKLILSDFTIYKAGNAGAAGSIQVYGTLEAYDRNQFYGNEASASGGAVRVYSTGKASINNCILYENKAVGTDGAGGAIFSEGNLNVSDTVFYNNRAGALGGAICVGSGTATISNSHFLTADDVVTSFGNVTFLGANTINATVNGSGFNVSEASFIFHDYSSAKLSGIEYRKHGLEVTSDFAGAKALTFKGTEGVTFSGTGNTVANTVTIEGDLTAWFIASNGKALTFATNADFANAAISVVDTKGTEDTADDVMKKDSSFVIGNYSYTFSNIDTQLTLNRSVDTAAFEAAVENAEAGSTVTLAGVSAGNADITGRADIGLEINSVTGIGKLYAAGADLTVSGTIEASRVYGGEKTAINSGSSDQTFGDIVFDASTTVEGSIAQIIGGGVLLVGGDGAVSGNKTGNVTINGSVNADIVSGGWAVGARSASNTGSITIGSNNTASTTLTINSNGSFGSVNGGCFVQNSALTSVTQIGNINLDINAGTYSLNIIGGINTVNTATRTSVEMAVEGNISVSLSNATIQNHVFGGNDGEGTVDGNTTITIGSNVIFDNTRSAVCGDSRAYAGNNYVTGERKLVFDVSEATADSKVKLNANHVLAFDSVECADWSLVDVSAVQRWDFLCETSLDFGTEATNSFAGDTLTVYNEDTLGDLSEAKQIFRGDTAGFAESKTVKLFGSSAEYGTVGDDTGWFASAGDDYSYLLKEDNNGLYISKVAGTLA